MNIVLHEPGIALNTGNIGRTCAATDTPLHLIRPYGFRITEKELKRAGMDYWEKIDLHQYIDYEDFLERVSPAFHRRENPAIADTRMETLMTECSADDICKEAAAASEGGTAADNNAAAGNTAGGRPKLWFATTKAQQCYTEVCYGPDDYIMLGNESRGIPEEILREHRDSCIRIPMWGDIRSLNLANSAAIILYEALRQNGFEKLGKRGELHRLTWKND